VELAKAVGTVRFTEGRLTGGFRFAPYSETSPPPSIPESVLRPVVKRMRHVAEAGSNPQALADLGILRLLEKRTNEAVVSLESAAAHAPDDARFQSDLAAAYLARAHEGDRPGDWIRALAAADGAVRSDPSLPEARFNRAVALEKLFLTNDAREAWQAVLRTGKDSGWAREAALRLQRLQGPADAEIWKKERDRLDKAALRGDQAEVTALVARFRQPARQYAEEDLLSSWAKATVSGQPADAERALRIARAIGAAQIRLHGDAMVRDGVVAIDAARSASPATCLPCLVRGHHLYADGARQVRDRQIDRAMQVLTEAEKELHQAGSPFVFWARFNLALCDYFRPHYPRTREALNRLRLDFAAGRYPILSARVSYVLSSMDVLTSRLGAALPSLQKVEQVFTSNGEIENLVMTNELLALGLGDLGETEEALKHLLRALRMRDRAPPSRVFAVVDLMALNCLRRGEIDVARYFQHELLSDALTQRIPSFVSFAHRRRARTFYFAGQHREALWDLEAADQQARAIPDGGIRRRQQAEDRMARGEIELALGQPAAAVQSLSAAIAVFGRTGFSYYVSNSLFVRARAFLTLGDERRADQDFRGGLREIERARDSAPEGLLRISLYDQATALFDEILSFQALRGEGDRAFDTSERVRARQLLDRSQPAGAILGVHEIQRRIPQGTVLVKYALLPDRLLVWALSADRVELRQVLLDAGTFTARVKQVCGLLQQGAPGTALGATLRELHRTLLAPVGDRVRGAGALVVVPDKILHLLPFAALVDPDTGRYVIQDHALSVSPSANVYVHCLERVGSVSKGGSALIVAADEFDRSRFPRLDPLRRAAEEARRIAAAYPGSRLLAGAEATREHFLDLASRGPQMIHFAGHALLNADHPDLSMLVFAGNGGKDGATVVYSFEVAGMNLAATRLVVLSACSTAAGRLSASEGATSLARSFLAAGVPAVVASLWDVDDPAAARLLVELHRRLRSGDDPITAVRAVQLSELGKASPAEWAAFQLIGGLPPPLQEGGKPWPSR
jgi:CHAT domain-containing protein